MSKNTWIILSIIILTFGVLIWRLMGNRPETDLSDIDPNRFIAADERNGEIADHIMGSPDEPVIIVEYSDYQCPACASVSPRIRAILASYDSDQVALIARNFPLANMFPNSRAAAAAAQAAGFQGQYWEMRELLFRNQRTWGSADISGRTALFASYAAELDLDVDRFTADMDLPSVRTKIDFDLNLGREKGVTGTPTFFINGERIDHSIIGDDERFRNLIDTFIRNNS